MGMVATTDCDLQGVFQTFAGPEATAFYKNWVSKKSVWEGHGFSRAARPS